MLKRDTERTILAVLVFLILLLFPSNLLSSSDSKSAEKIQKKLSEFIAVQIN